MFLLLPNLASAGEAPIIHDAEHYILLEQHEDQWAQEDTQIDKKLADLRAANGGKSPNIVYVLLDDLGFGDLSIYNPKAAYKTPRIDRMAREGIMFTDAHSPSTICSPSRYGLFSGQQIYRSTGRGGGAALQTVMDTVSEVKEIKHAFRAGIMARKGVDY